MLALARIAPAVVMRALARIAPAVVMRALALLALAACSSHSTKPAASNGSATSGVAMTSPGSAAVPAGTPPALAPPPTAPAPAAAPPAPIDLKAALASLPAMKADPMIMPGTTPDGRQVHGTWCLRGTGADGVMRDLAAQLTGAGWSNVTTRGDATKAGVSAERDGYRASYVVSASTANACRAPGHYFASLTMFAMKP